MKLSAGKLRALETMRDGGLYAFDTLNGHVRIPMFRLGMLEHCGDDARGPLMRLTPLAIETKAALRLK